jgi:hypothetical protein
MKPYQTLFFKKHPRKGEKKETKGKDQSSGKQTAQKRVKKLYVRINNNDGC